MSILNYAQILTLNGSYNCFEEYNATDQEFELNLKH